MLPELEREDFIATRQEEVTSRRLRRDVAQMAARSAGAASGPNKKKKKVTAAASDDEDDDYDGASRATRSRKTTGSSKTKSEGIEKLKQSRAAKGKKKQAKVLLDAVPTPTRMSDRKGSSFLTCSGTCATGQRQRRRL